jgi:ABC-type branched-subunit amino acid transport system substrate-binding protein
MKTVHIGNRWVRTAGLLTAVVLAAAACGSSSKSSSSSSSSGSSSGTSSGSTSGSTGKSLQVDYIADLTGPQASTQGQPSVAAARAAVDAQNASGGVNGYQFKLKVINTLATPAGGTNAVREAIADKPYAIAFSSNYVDASSNLLLQSDIPTFADYSPSWGVTIKGPNTFPVWGNLSTRNTTGWMVPCVSAGRTKVALPAGTYPGVQVSQAIYTQVVNQSGAKVVYSRIGIDSSNAAQVQQAARQIISSGANCAISTIIPGTPLLQAAINQLGGNVWVVSPSDYGKAVEEQFGKTADNMLYEAYFAPLELTSNPGVAQYEADMAKYQPQQDPRGIWVGAYTVLKYMMYASSLIKGAPTSAQLNQTANSVKGYDENGLIPPVNFPPFQLGTDNPPCLGVDQMVNGKFVPFKGAGINANGFACGKTFGAGGS